uniref:Aminopeptidase n=1 Tax=Saccoglossus kowalevskii TaxID=10224 RepID=A0ABM0MDB0_SACKO|nr:PREDICTED: aminopeptidase N-like [Saccoglossus kowalevskii]
MGYDEDASQRGRGIFLTTSTILIACFATTTLIAGVGILSYYLPTPCTAIAEHILNGSTYSPSTLSPPPSSSNPWEDYRLPTDIEPVHYTLELKIDSEKFSFNGSIDIRVTCINRTSRIILHSKMLDIYKNLVRVTREVDSMTIQLLKEPELYPDMQYIVITLASYLEGGQLYIVHIEYGGVLYDDLVGIYRSSYRDDKGQKRVLAASFFSPANARKAYPCFDEPALKATLAITMVHKDEYTALSNMPQESVTSRYDGWVATKFQTTLKMSTYITGFFLSDFESVTAVSRNGVEVRTWARADAIHEVYYGMNISLPILEYYEHYFDIDFPLPKIDMAVTPDYGAGGMENWGLINYREASYLSDSSSTVFKKRRTAELVAHELAHQWFGNLATHWWWEDVWLKEGFASFMAYYGMDLVEPDWNMLDQFLILDVHVAFGLDALTSSHPISVPVNHVDEINSIFDSISYSKGASIIRMLRYFLGETTFRNGLKIFPNQKTNTIVHTFVGSRLDYCNSLLYGIMNVSYWEGHRRYKWIIPLTFTDGLDPKYGENERNRIWLSNGPVFMNDSSKLSGGNNNWLLANIDQTGYFRVNYDATNWRLLKEQLLENHLVIPTASRAAILNDVFNLARGQHINTLLALEISRYLVVERDYVPWSTANDVLAYIHNMLRTTSAYGVYIQYILELVTPLYSSLGWSDEDSTDLDSLTRSLAITLACGHGHEECIQESHTMFVHWMQNSDNNMIPENMKSDVYCTAIAHGTSDYWEFAWNQYLTTQSSAERSLLMEAMACSNQPWILSRYLNYCLDSQLIRRQDATYVVGYIAGSAVGEVLAWDFVRSHWDHLFDTYGTNMFSFPRLIDSVTASFSSRLRLKELQKFISDHPNLGTAAKSFEQAVERTRVNILWHENTIVDLQKWLEDEVRVV